MKLSKLFLIAVWSAIPVTISAAQNAEALAFAANVLGVGSYNFPSTRQLSIRVLDTAGSGSGENPQNSGCVVTVGQFRQLFPAVLAQHSGGKCLPIDEHNRQIERRNQQIEELQRELLSCESAATRALCITGGVMLAYLIIATRL